MKARVPLSAAVVAIVIVGGIAALLGHRARSTETASPALGSANVSVTGRAHPWPRLPRYRKASGWAALPARRHPASVITPVSSEVSESSPAETETGTYSPSEESPYIPPAEPAPSSGSGGGGSSGSREFGVTYTR